MNFESPKCIASAIVLLGSVGAVLLSAPAAAESHAYPSYSASPAYPKHSAQPAGQPEFRVEQTPEAYIAPAVHSFEMAPSGDLKPGQVLHFRVKGTPHAKAWINVPPRVVVGLMLHEVRPGLYVGRHRLRDWEDPRAFYNSEVVMRSGRQQLVVHLNGERHYVQVR